ncbi:hypothetical protein GYMLUDRAFT_557977 [Collybiopsis luxurians FD-317 M1]|uniref:Uncharacterized protein n=1 Tax=Collybiopsis luxurians FD-317 M1 TaxID=944289 RepID=A0A0D0CZB1_9AGAR|nr:hypothetical protein GYMLUDRAFT_557977 [Collybiopsis luxurians FD-317 M1]
MINWLQRVPIAKAQVMPTRVLRSQRQSNSPSLSKPSTPTPTPATTPAPTAPPPPPPPAPAPPLTIVLPFFNSTSTSKTRKTKEKPKPKPAACAPPTSTSAPIPAAPIVKTEPLPAQIQPYKKLPCRGDTVQMRIAKLQADLWSDPSKLTAKSVYCLGCQKKVCLDKRFDYYPGFWETHKKRCPGVQSGMPPPPRISPLSSQGMLMPMQAKAASPPNLQ